jgi:hypothetical protein
VKLRKRWLFLGRAILIVAGALVLARQHQLVYATPETESAFFQRYELEPIAEPFFSEKHVSALAGGESAGAGERSATHDKNFDYHFVIQTANWMPLMNAVAANMTDELRRAGADLISVSGDERQGFRYEYISGNTMGTAEIRPLEIPDLQQQRPKCMRGNEATARLQVTIREEWFKEKPGLMRVSVQSDVR